MNNTSITITTGTIFRAIFIILLFVLVYVLRDLALILLTSVVLASSVEPATTWFAKYKVPRVVAVIIVYLLVFGILGGVLFLFVPMFIEQVGQLAGMLNSYIDVFDNMSDPTGNIAVLSDSFSLSQSIDALKASVSGISGNILELAATVFGGFFGFIMVVVLSFYMAVQDKGIEDFLRMVAPVKHEAYVLDLWKRAHKKIGKWMQGQLLLAALIGVLVYLGLTVLGIKYALVLALLAAVMEVIPIFGPTLSAIPAIALGFVDSISLGLFVLALYIIIQQFENHLIYPLVVRKVVGVPPIIVILALIIGGQLAGFMGILLSVPVAAVLLEFAEDMQKEKRLRAAK